MIKLSNILAIVLSFVMLVGLTGCGSQKPQETPGGNSPATSGSNDGNRNQEPVTLNVILPANIEGQLLKKSIPDFEAETGISIMLNEVPVDALNTKITVELESGSTTTDVAGYPYEWLPKLANNLLVLDSYISAEDKNDILPYAWDSASYNGKILGQMYTVTGMIMFYRKDLLDNAGITPPTTWESYREVAKALTTNDVYGTIVTAKLAEEPVGMFLNYLYQAGGDIIDENGKVILNNEAGVKALQFMYDLVYKDKVAPEAANTYTTNETTALFMEGKIALAPNWSYMWSVTQAEGSPMVGKVGMALLPEGEKAGISLGGWVLSVFGPTKYPEEAYKFIQFMNDTKRQKIMALECGNTPTRLSTLEDEEIKANPLFGIMSEALKTSVPRSKYPKFDQISNEISIALSGCLGNTGTPKELLDIAAKNIEAILD